MNNTKKLLILSALSTVLGTQTAQATSTFSVFSSVTINIDSITNNTNAGDLSSISITDGFYLGDELSADGFGKIVHGNANSSFTYSGGYQDGADGTLGTSMGLNQQFLATGTATDGDVDAYYQAFGEIYFVNNSTDSYTIEYSLDYSLGADATGDFADTTVILEYFNDRGDIEGYEEATASSGFEPNNQNSPIAFFTLDLAAWEQDILYADVAITGYAQAVAPVPVPAAGWLMLSGLVFLRNYRKQ